MTIHKKRLLSDLGPYIYYHLRIWQKRICRIIGSYRYRHKYASTFSPGKLPYRYTIHSSKLLRNYLDDPKQFEWQVNKVTNLKLAISKINYILIKPGQIFSFHKLVGRPTAKKGYLEGMELSRGKAGPGIGGGLCQLSNLLNWLCWHTPLQIIERSNHSYDPFPDVDRILPFGSGAALFWNYIDFQIMNPTQEIFQICLWLGKNSLHGEIRCIHYPDFKYHIFEKNHYFIQRNDEWFRSNEIWRTVYHRGGNGISQSFLCDEFLVRNFSKVMYEPDTEKYEIKQNK